MESSITERDQRAEQQQRDQALLAGMILAELLPHLAQVRTAILHAIMGGQNLTIAAALAASPMVRVLREGRLGGHLAGRLNEYQRAAAARPDLPTPTLSREELAGLRQLAHDAAILDVGVWVDWVAHEAQATAGSGPASTETLTRVAQRLDALGLATAHPYGIEMLAEKAVHVGYAEGQDAAHDAPALLEVLVGIEYVSRRDEKVRKTHRKLDGQVADPHDRETLRKFNDALDEPNCRCQKVSLWGPPRSNPKPI